MGDRVLGILSFSVFSASSLSLASLVSQKTSVFLQKNGQTHLLGRLSDGTAVAVNYRWQSWNEAEKFRFFAEKRGFSGNPA